MLKVTVEESDSGNLVQSSFEIEQQKELWSIDKENFEGDIVKISENKFHVIWNNTSYNVEILESNPSAKTFKLLINGKLYSTSVKDQFDLLLEGMGMETKAAKKINNLKAPMPGMIQSIAVAQGDQVQKGDTLLVLVAMKMENIIKSSGDGVVKSLKVVAGEIVEKNQVMLEFE